MFWWVVLLCIFIHCLYLDSPYGLVKVAQLIKIQTKIFNKIHINIKPVINGGALFISQDKC